MITVATLQFEQWQFVTLYKPATHLSLCDKHIFIKWNITSINRIVLPGLCIVVENTAPKLVLML